MTWLLTGTGLATFLALSVRLALRDGLASHLFTTTQKLMARFDELLESRKKNETKDTE